MKSINTFEGLSNRARHYFASSQQHVFFILRCMQILLLLMLRSTTSLVLLLANGTMNRIYRLLIPNILQGVQKLRRPGQIDKQRMLFYCTKITLHPFENDINSSWKYLIACDKIILIIIKIILLPRLIWAGNKDLKIDWS